MIHASREWQEQALAMPERDFPEKLTNEQLLVTLCNFYEAQYFHAAEAEIIRAELRKRGFEVQE